MTTEIGRNTDAVVGNVNFAGIEILPIENYGKTKQNILRLEGRTGTLTKVWKKTHSLSGSGRFWRNISTKKTFILQAGISKYSQEGKRNMEEYWRLRERTSFVISAENPTGKRAGGGCGGDCTKLHPTVRIKPGDTVTLADIDGPGMIRHIWMTGYIGHSFILRMYWEGEEAPSVEAPISAFFGDAYDEDFADRDGKYPVLNSALLLMAPGRGYNCYFKMPFRKHCRITMQNRSDEVKDLYYSISGDFEEIPEDTGYFHASYRQEHPVTKGRSYTVIDGIEGRGQFLGLTLATGMNGNNTCWVEGEARMFIDDDKYPSMHYTGTEDYFGGAYGFGNDIEQKQYTPFCGLYTGLYAVLGDPKQFYRQQQRFLLYHFHVPDPITFSKRFRMTLDNLGWTGPRYDDYTSVAYWYQTLPHAKLKALPEDKEMIMK